MIIATAKQDEIFNGYIVKLRTFICGNNDLLNVAQGIVMRM
jgi:hypothetical protein